MQKEAAKHIKTEKGLNDFSKMLTKVTVEAALNSEFDEHLGYDRHEGAGYCFYSIAALGQLALLVNYM